MHRDIKLLLIGAGIGFFINFTAGLLEVGLKHWAERVYKKNTIEKDYGNIKVSTTPEIMRLLNPDQDEGRDFKEKSIKEKYGVKIKFNWKMVPKYLISMAFWAVVVYLLARNW